MSQTRLGTISVDFDLLKKDVQGLIQSAQINSESMKELRITVEGMVVVSKQRQDENDLLREQLKVHQQTIDRLLAHQTEQTDLNNSIVARLSNLEGANSTIGNKEQDDDWQQIIGRRQQRHQRQSAASKQASDRFEAEERYGKATNAVVAYAPEPPNSVTSNDDPEERESSQNPDLRIIREVLTELGGAGACASQAFRMEKKQAKKLQPEPDSQSNVEAKKDGLGLGIRNRPLKVILNSQKAKSILLGFDGQRLLAKKYKPYSADPEGEEGPKLFARHDLTFKQRTDLYELNRFVKFLRLENPSTNVVSRIRSSTDDPILCERRRRGDGFTYSEICQPISAMFAQYGYKCEQRTTTGRVSPQK